MLVIKGRDVRDHPGLLEVVNDPSYVARVQVRAVPGEEGLAVEAQFKPYRFIDASGQPLAVEPVGGWLGTYATMGLKRPAPAGLVVPLAPGRSLTLPWSLDGPPGDRETTAYRSATIEAAGRQVFRSTTIGGLAGSAPGLPSLLADTRYWREPPPRSVGGQVSFRLRPIEVEPDGAVRWSVDWGDDPLNPLNMALGLHGGSPARVTLAATTGLVRDRPAFRVETTLATFPSGPIRPYRGLLLRVGEVAIGDPASLDGLREGRDIFWDLAYALPPRIEDGRLVLTLRPFAFVDVRDQPLTPKEPASGWLEFYKTVRSRRPIEIGFVESGVEKLRNVELPPPGSVLVPEPAVAVVDTTANLRASIGLSSLDLDDRGPGLRPLLRKGRQFFRASQLEPAHTPGRALFFFADRAVGRRTAPIIARVVRPGVRPPAELAVPGRLDPLLALPARIPCEPGAVVRLSHKVPAALGYDRGGYEVTLTARNGMVHLDEGPADLRFIREIRVGLDGGASYSLFPPVSPGRDDDVIDGLVSDAFVAWWSKLRLDGIDGKATVMLVVDGSEGNLQEPADRTDEWSRWKRAIDRAREELGTKLVVAVARGGDLAEVGAGPLGGPHGDSCLLDPALRIMLRNTTARHPGISKVAVMVAGDPALVGPAVVKGLGPTPGEPGPKVVLVADRDATAGTLTNRLR
jgi:hypothetical protein